MDGYQETINDLHDNFENSGRPVNWVSISLTHVEYQEGEINLMRLICIEAVNKFDFVYNFTGVVESNAADPDRRVVYVYIIIHLAMLS